MDPTESQTDAFYRTAALGLAWLDARESTPRRFGAAADATWRNYAGQPATLTELDRVELLLREAATLHPAAFGPRAVFALKGLTEDEPFGQWLHTPAPGVARDVLRAPRWSAVGVRVLLEAAASAWATPLTMPASLPALGPTTRVLCAGAGALVALFAHFESDRALDVAEQLVVLTDEPAVRQLAGLGAMALGATRAVRVLSPSLDPAALCGEGITRLDALVLSEDVGRAERVAAEAWLAALAR